MIKLICRQHSQSDIVSNYEHYERLFEESATATNTLPLKIQQAAAKINYNAIVKVSREPAVENPHFSLPETFHNALSFRNYENHGFSTSITFLLETNVDTLEVFNPTCKELRQKRRGNQYDDLYNPEYNHLRKNTPRDFPMIVRQAMAEQEKDNSRKLGIKMKLPQDEGNNFSLPSLPQSVSDEPETPSIENAPESIDFTSAVNSNLSSSSSSNQSNLKTDTVVNTNDTDDENNEISTSNIYLNFKKFKLSPKRYRCTNSESSGFSSNNDDDDDHDEYGQDEDKHTEDFLNNINALNLDDDGDTNNYSCDDYSASMKSLRNLRLNDLSSDVNSNVTISPTSSGGNNTTNIDDDEDEDDLKQFNSHQYWYISPDIPVDMDIFLEPEEKSEYC